VSKIDFQRDDLIDTRDIVARIGEIELDNTDDEGELTPQDQWSVEDRAEHRGLTEVLDEVGDEAGHGVTLISDHHFTDYIKDLHLEIGSELYEFNPGTYRHERISREELFSRSPFNRIDWDEVADDHRSDYSILEIDGRTYYYQGR